MYRDSQKDYPAPATHNIVLVSAVEPDGPWVGGQYTPFIGKVISLWEWHTTPESLERRIQELMQVHKVSREEITVDDRQ